MKRPSSSQPFVPHQVVLTTALQRSAFDITLPTPASFPPPYSMAYFNQRWVQEALGVPVNFTLSADAVVNNFMASTGDSVIVTKSALESVLDSGVGVASKQLLDTISTPFDNKNLPTIAYSSKTSQGLRL